MNRVASYIRNGWETDFVEKWRHLGGRKQTQSTDTRITADTACKFDNRRWIALRDAKESIPNFSMQNMVSYFIERKAKDHDSNKDYKNVSSKAFGLFRHGHIQKIELAFDNNAFLK